MNVEASVKRLLDVNGKQRVLFDIVYSPNNGVRRVPRATLSHTLVVEPVCCPHCGASRK
jgi:hypothetical protein